MMTRRECHKVAFSVIMMRKEWKEKGIINMIG